MPQTEIEEEVSARDVDEMRRFYGEDPWGSWRENVHFAHLSALLANINRGKGVSPFSPEQFMVFDRFDREQTEKRRVIEYFKSIGSVVKRHRNWKKPRKDE